MFQLKKAAAKCVNSYFPNQLRLLSTIGNRPAATFSSKEPSQTVEIPSNSSSNYAFITSSAPVPNTADKDALGRENYLFGKERVLI